MTYITRDLNRFDENRRIKVALCQRICPPFRVPIWNLLAQKSRIDLTLLYGFGAGSGSSSGSGNGIIFPSILLRSLNFKIGDKLRVLHLGLIPKILQGKFDIVISEGLTYFPNSLVLALVCKLVHIPFILYETPPIGDETKLRTVISPLYRKLTTRIITYTSWGREYYKARGFSHENITVAQNTIDTDTVLKRLEDAKSLKDDLVRKYSLAASFVIGYLGSIEERKQPNVLLESTLQLLREGFDVKLLYIGDGKFRASLEEMIPDKVRDNVIMLGRQDSPEKFLQVCSILVLPAQGGLAVPHGLTCGVPCIATEDAEGPGIRDYIQHGKNGLVLGMPITNYLTDTLRELIDSPEILYHLKEGAKNSAKLFSVGNMITQIENAVLESYYPFRKENN